MGFDFEIRYKLRLENKAADALSLVSSSGEAELAAFTFSKVLDILKVDEEVEGDPHLAKIRREVGQGSDEWPKYSLTNGHLMYRGCLVLPRGSSLIPSLLYDYHNSIAGGHSGF